MQRRSFLLSSGLLAMAGRPARAAEAAQTGFSYQPPVTIAAQLPLPETGRIRVAFAINPGVQVIDLAGPWEAFQDTFVRSGESPLPGHPFELYTVSESTAPLRASGGLGIVPGFSVRDAPDPHVLVVPHFDTRDTTSIHEWMKQVAAQATLSMTVCTGAFQFAKTGLLDGRPATTNANMYDRFARDFPRVNLLRGPRFVETEGISTAGGLTAGIDLSLRVVQRFFGVAIAQRTADFMEYVGRGWKM